MRLESLYSHCSLDLACWLGSSFVDGDAKLKQRKRTQTFRVLYFSNERMIGNRITILSNHPEMFHKKVMLILSISMNGLNITNGRF